jgi:hypothetical protein
MNLNLKIIIIIITTNFLFIILLSLVNPILVPNLYFSIFLKLLFILALNLDLNSFVNKIFIQLNLDFFLAIINNLDNLLSSLFTIQLYFLIILSLNLF